ncbi:hypothetical protein UUU_26010 (plasmid) [Klebsiella pneumoniae subsp. pneumoniae DSM 30104 = JCM 1662 = NBRC 14940]|nr:hypothetical protein UUU_26010 [Klebsiella pneumoniae subsp. pneumoniae DSM 30104 = JCM 1662 = NBRC 14940]
MPAIPSWRASPSATRAQNARWLSAEVVFSGETDAVLSVNGCPAPRRKGLVANLGQVVSGQTGHLHDRIAIKAICQHGAGDFQCSFAFTFLASFFHTALFTQLDTFLNTLLDTFLDTLLDTFLFKLLCDGHQFLLMLRYPQGQCADKCLRIRRFTGLDNIVYQRNHQWRRQIAGQQNGGQPVGQFGQVALANMFLQQGQSGHAVVTHNLFVGNDRHINQRKIAGVQFPGQRWIIKLLQPVGRVRVWAAFAGIEKYRNDQRQLFVASVEMTLHSGNGIANEAKRHVLIRAGLVLDKYHHVTVSAGGGFQAVEHVAEILAQVIFDKGAGLQLQRAEVTDGPQFGR